MSHYYDAFGHQAWNLEHYSRSYMKEYGRFPRVVAFHRADFIPNEALFKRHQDGGVYIFPTNSVFTRLFRMARSGYTDMTASDPTPERPYQLLLFCRSSMNDLHVNTFVNQEAPIAFPFSPSEEDKATAVLSRYKLRRYQYVCFQDRNINYRKQVPIDLHRRTETSVTDEQAENSDLSLPNKDSRSRWYEQYEESKYEHARNTTLATLYQAVDFLHENQLCSVRVGANPDQAAIASNMIDYSSIRTNDDEFSDLALANYCKFFVGPNSGIWLLARAFNRPVCLVNVFPWPWINVPMPEDSMVMPKKLWHAEEKRFLTIYEMIQMENKFSWKKFYNPHFFEQLGVRPVENSSEEITQAVKEMNFRIDNQDFSPEHRVSNYLATSSLAKHSKAVFPSYFVNSNSDLFPKTTIAT